MRLYPVGSWLANLLVCVASAVVLSQTSYPGSLAEFSQPTALGRAAADWGIPLAGQGASLPPLHPADRAYDPLQAPGLERRVPSSCAEPGSPCQSCVTSAEESIQFNLRYLHVAWSAAHSQLASAERSTAAREAYLRKYTDHMQNIRRAIDGLASCESGDPSGVGLFRRHSEAFYDSVVARYGALEP